MPAFMDAKQQHKGSSKAPKLERRNAIKNIDYDATSSSPSSSSSFGEQSPNLRTRSLDLSPLSDNKTSFRIKGIDGEFDKLCRTLGFSGPEDFAIPTDVWEAQKARSSSDISARLLKDFNSPKVDPVILSRQFEAKVRVSTSNFKQEFDDSSKLISGNKVRVFDKGFVGPSNGEIKNEIIKGGGGGGGGIEGDRPRVLASPPVKLPPVVDKGCVSPSNGEIKNEIIKGPSKGGGGGGIKGERPPVLAPPPVKLPPVVDNVSTTWDIFNSFAPREDEDLVSPVQVGFIGQLENEDRVIEPNEVVNEERLNVVRLGVTDQVSPTFTSTSGDDDNVNDDDDDDDDEDDGGDVFDVIMEPVFNISPHGRFRLTITSWQKGELLGSGSFGTVYEGFTE